VTDPHPYLVEAHPQVVRAIAHRGGDEQRENTLVAFAAAAATGLRHLETDVHTTSDGVLVISHDPTLARVAGDPRPIATLTSAEVSALRVGGVEPVPTLAELLTSFPAARFSIDLKDEASVAPMRRLLAQDPSLRERVCIGSFAGERVLPLRAEFGASLCTFATPQEVLRLVLAGRLRRRPPRIGGDVLAIPERYPLERPRLRVLDVRLLAMAAETGRAVHVWTVNEPQRMRELVALGVDGIITDRPSVLRDVLVDLERWG
jgi:glycerophosphoryl diester phosphodiesterase